ncbi:MAG: class I SAM-dependent methyltransferase [Patescibacteria group bacterium]
MLDLPIFIILFLAIITVFGTAAWAGLLAAPFVPTKKKDIKRMLTLAQVKASDQIYELGSGDGRIAQVAAKEFGARVQGIEISFLPYIISKIRMRLTGLSDRVKIAYGNFYKVDLKNADVVICFLTPMAMKKLSPKFRKELKQGARVVSYAFPLKDWSPQKVNKPHKGDVAVFLYGID